MKNSDCQGRRQKAEGKRENCDHCPTNELFSLLPYPFSLVSITFFSNLLGVSQLVEAGVDRGHRDVDVLLQVGDDIRLQALDVSPVQRHEIPCAVTAAQTLDN